jgi:predicted anti-sigma-YlaC factor YlaD
MTCEELYRRLTDLSEGVLQGEVCAEVDRHLAECYACQAIRHDLEDLSRLCRETRSAAAMPAELRQRIETMLGASGG